MAYQMPTKITSMKTKDNLAPPDRGIQESHYMIKNSASQAIHHSDFRILTRKLNLILDFFR
ncbi:hypothetical protein Q672_09215 [Marinobacter sp. EVN1]|nr:hypothetical protein Q672_09215 [Marinobacter sp. EVN1]